jgi:hypothetical protein
MSFFRRSKNTNKPILIQILKHLPAHLLNYEILKHQSDKGCSKYKTYDQLLALSFGQLNKCYTLGDISCGLAVSGTFLSDVGLHQSPSKSTMSDGNKMRNYQVFESLYCKLVSYHGKALKKHHQSHIMKEIEKPVIKIIDSTTVSLCLSTFNWAKFRTAKGGLKLHTAIDDQTGLPEVVNISEAKLHDSKGFENNVFDKGTIILEDRAYLNYSLMLRRIKADNIFVTRKKSNTIYESLKELDLPINEDQDILKDEIIKLTGIRAEKSGMSEMKLRLVTIYKADENKIIEVITNNLEWSARTIADLYKKRWDIELFFKSLKQNLQIKTFLGTSPNAVKSQIYVALINYLILELIRRIYTKSKTAFSSFCEKIRMCLMHYLSLSYVCNDLKPIVKKVVKSPSVNLFDGLNSQLKIKFNT